MNERFGPNTFERLAQGSEARSAQIEAGREIDDEEILVLEDPQIIFFSRLKDSLSRILKPVNGKVVVPVGIVLLTIAAACSGGGGEKPEQSKSPDNFADNLPAELFDACREYVQSETVGDVHDQTGYSLSTQYLQEHPNDNRALYLASAGAFFLSGLQQPRIGFEMAQKGGLPDKQSEIASDIVDGLDLFIGLIRSEGEDKILDDPENIDEVLDALLTPMDDLRRDLEENVCPDSAERPAGGDDEQPIGSRYAYRDLLDNLLIDRGSSYSIPVASQLANYDYQHIADVQEVTQVIKSDVLILDAANSLQTEFLINYAITIPAKYMIENQQLGVATDTLNGAQVLLDVLQDEDYPLITYQLAPVAIRDRLIFFLGDEKGKEIFNELGKAILFNLETAQGQQLWNRLTPEDRLLLEP